MGSVDAPRTGDITTTITTITTGTRMGGLATVTATAAGPVPPVRPATTPRPARWVPPTPPPSSSRAPVGVGGKSSWGWS